MTILNLSDTFTNMKPYEQSMSIVDLLEPVIKKKQITVKEWKEIRKQSTNLFNALEKKFKRQIAEEQGCAVLYMFSALNDLHLEDKSKEFNFFEILDTYNSDLNYYADRWGLARYFTAKCLFFVLEYVWAWNINNKNKSGKGYIDPERIVSKIKL